MKKVVKQKNNINWISLLQDLINRLFKRTHTPTQKHPTTIKKKEQTENIISTQEKAPPIIEPVPKAEKTKPIINTGFLCCPIGEKDDNGKTLTSHTVKISAVLDHSGTDIDPNSSNWWGKNAKDGKVKAFNNEIGDGLSCSTEEPRGYFKNNSDETFFDNGEIKYVGVSSERGNHGLQYDGHAGYDFPYSTMTPVVAPAKGNLFKASRGKDKIYGARWGSDSDNSFYIEHENGFVTWFRHCIKLHNDVEKIILEDFSKPCPVEKEQVVAYVGKIGTWAIHLHFEVRNKDGKIVDPYKDGLWIE